LFQIGVNTADEEVGWDEDSDSESESPSTPQVKSNKPSTDSSQHLAASDNATLKPIEPRRSNDQQSQPDSESSYDVVSGATSHTPSSPREKPATASGVAKGDESDEDWE
jgi:hypothetical protein